MMPISINLQHEIRKLFTFLICLTLLLTGSVFANGKIILAIGNVKVGNIKGWKKTTAGTVLKKGDLVKTGKNSTVIIELSQGAKIKLRSNSQIQFTEMANTKKRSKVLLDLQRGSTFASVIKRDASDSFQIRSMTVTAGVRGTEFFVATGESIRQNQVPEIMMCVKEGKIMVTSLSDEKGKLINEGEGVVFIPRKKIPTPERLPWIKDLNWNMTGKNVEDKTFLKEVYQSSYRDKLNQNYD